MQIFLEKFHRFFSPRKSYHASFCKSRHARICRIILINAVTQYQNQKGEGQVKGGKGSNVEISQARVSRRDSTQPYVNRVLSQPTDGHTVENSRILPYLCVSRGHVRSRGYSVTCVFKGEFHLEGECVICVCV